MKHELFETQKNSHIPVTFKHPAGLLVNRLKSPNLKCFDEITYYCYIQETSHSSTGEG